MSRDISCPICGGPCTDWSWRNYQHCNACESLLKQGLSVDKVRVLRNDQLLDEGLEPSDKITAISVLREKYKLYEYDFNKKFPKGIFLFVNDKTESETLRETYEQYAHFGENLVEFPTIIGGILQFRLERHRISQELAKIGDDALTVNARKHYLDILEKIDRRIKETTETLINIKKERGSRALSIITEEFQNMIKFYAENEQSYKGIGVCPDCNQRIIFKTHFPTFRARYLEEIDKIGELINERGNYDQSTINAFISEIKNKLNDDSIKDTYTVEFTRELEKHLSDYTMGGSTTNEENN